MLRKRSFTMLLIALALTMIGDHHWMTTVAQPEATSRPAEHTGRVIMDSSMLHIPFPAQPRGSENEPDTEHITYVIIGRDRIVSPLLMSRLAELKRMGQISTFDAQYVLGRVLVQGAPDIIRVLRSLPDVATVTRPDSPWDQAAHNSVPAPTPIGKGPGSSGAIIGTVTGADSGLPLNNIYIWVYCGSCGEEFQDTTTSSGSFLLSGLPTGRYDMYLSDSNGVYASGWYDNKTYSTHDFISVTDGMTTVVNIKWGLAGVIQGTITDEASGAPLPDAYVQLYDEVAYPTQCSCSYLPLIIAPYLPAVLVEPSPMPLDPPVRSQSVCSQYCSKKDGTMAPYPIAGVGADLSGAFRIGGLVAADYRLRFDQWDGDHVAEYYDKRARLSEADVIHVTAGTTATINAQLAQGGVITGVLTARDTGAPASSVSVTVYDAVTGEYMQRFGQTDYVGKFHIEGLGTGDYKLYFGGSDEYLAEYYNHRHDISSADAVHVTAGLTTTISAQLTVGGAIAGKVTAEDSGAPANGVWASIYDAASGYYVKSSQESNGSYRIGGLDTGDYKLYFDGYSEYLPEYYHDKLDWSTADVIHVTAGLTTTADAQLTHLSVITGVVTAQDSGAPLKGVQVFAYDPGGAWVGQSETGPSGLYGMGRLGPGRYRLQFSDPSGHYASEYYDGKPDLSSADDVTVTAGSVTRADAQLWPLGIIAGALTAEDTGAPIGNIRVTVYNTTCCGGTRSAISADSTGAFYIDGLVTGSYKLEFFDPSGRYAAEYYDDRPDLSSADAISATPGLTTTVDAQLARAGVIAGAVTAKDSGAPLDYISITASDATGGSVPFGSTTSLSGTYRIGGLKPGHYKLEFTDWSRWYAPQYFDDKPDLSSAGVITVVAGLTTTANAQLSLLGIIAGVVTTQDGGAPAANIGLVVYDAVSETSTGYSATDSNGSFRIGGLKTGRYKLSWYDYQGRYATEYYNHKPDLFSADPISVTSSMTTTINITVRSGGALAGRVTDLRTGQGIANVGVSAAPQIGYISYGSATTDANGYYTATHMSTGVYQVSFYPPQPYWSEYYDNQRYPDLATRFVTVTVPYTTANIDAALQAGYMISGRITGTDIGYSPEVRAYRDADSVNSRYAELDGDGTYRLGPLDPGAYRVYFESHGWDAGEWYNDSASYADATVLDLAGDMPNVNAELSAGGHLAGTVTGESDAPLPYAGVTVYRAGSRIAAAYGGADSHGQYMTSPGLETGLYQAYFSKYGYASEWYDDQPTQETAFVISVTSGMTTSINARLSLVADPGPSPTGAITGLVTAVDTGLPLEAFVYVSSQGENLFNTYTVEGAYAMRLPPGVYNLYFSVPLPYLSRYYSNTFGLEYATPVTVTAGVTLTNINQAISRRGFITGTVSGPGALAGIAVSANRLGGNRLVRQAYTGLDGRYHLDNLEPGDYRVQFTFPGSPFAMPMTVSVTSDAVTQAANPVVMMGGLITGVVTAADTGAPLSGAVVQFSLGATATYTTRADMDGYYQSPGLLPGDYQVLFSVGPWTHYLPKSYGDGLTVTVPAAGTITNVNAALMRGGSIQGWTRRAWNGLSLSSVEVSVYGSTSRLTTSSNDWGYYLVEGLPSGAYTVQFSRDGYNTLWYSNTLDASSALPIVVNAPADVPNINADLTDSHAVYLPPTLRH